MIEPHDVTGREIYSPVTAASIKKASERRSDSFLFGFLGGIFIALASAGSTMAAFNLLSRAETYGLGKALAGAIFGTGLMLVVIAGGELFTGNALMLSTLFDRQITLLAMLRNWLWVYLGNMVGSITIALLMAASGLFYSAAGGFGAVTLKIALSKVHLSFLQATSLGILCNILVCSAVWMAYGAHSISGKILAIFFPIWLFITSGFEHSVANMYYIPVGLLIKSDPILIEAAGQIGTKALGDLTWLSFLFNNLLPVSLGNVIGGGVLVALSYRRLYRK